MSRTLLLAAAASSLLAASTAGAQPAPVWSHDGGFVQIAADASGVYATRPGTPYVPPENYGYGQVYPVATVKLSSDGAELWMRQHPGFDPGHDIWNSPGDVAVGPAGEVVHAFTEQCVNGFHSNGVVLRYGAGAELSWAASFYVGRFNYPYAVAVDAAGNTYLAAFFATGGWGDPVIYHAGVAKYDPSGAPVVGPGSLPWYNLPTIELPAEFAGWGNAFDVAVDGDQHVFVTGAPGTFKYDGATFALAWSSPFAGAQVVAAGDGGAYVTGAGGTARLGAGGELLWTAPVAGRQLALVGGGVMVTDGASTVQLGPDGAARWSMPVGGSDLAHDGGAYVYLLSGGVISKYGLDQDGDGFPVTEDCNDADPSIHPGAAEVKSDGVDQDCNGYDLTITTVKAQHQARADLLRVEATSALGAGAQLAVVGFGPMRWEPLDLKWVLNVRPAGGNPGTVTVTGLEGADLPTAVHAIR